MKPFNIADTFVALQQDGSARCERHPAGEEFVCLLEGEAELHLESEDGTRKTVVLDQPGAFVLVPPTAWHTIKVRRPSRMLFVTVGEGTQHRPL